MNFSKINVQSVINHKIGNQIRINFNMWDLILLEDDKQYHLSRAISIIIQDFQFINLNEIVFFTVSGVGANKSSLKEFKLKELMNEYQFRKTILEELDKNKINFITDEELLELYSDDITLLNYELMIASLKEKIEESLINKDKKSFMKYTNQIKDLKIEKEKIYHNQAILTDKDKKDMDELLKSLESMLAESKINVLLDKALLNRDEKLFNKCIKDLEKLKKNKLKEIDQ